MSGFIQNRETAADRRRLNAVCRDGLATVNVKAMPIDSLFREKKVNGTLFGLSLPFQGYHRGCGGIDALRCVRKTGWHGTLKRGRRGIDNTLFSKLLRKDGTGAA